VELDRSAARAVLNRLLTKAPHTALRVGGQTAQLYAVVISAKDAGLLLELCNWRNRVVRQNKVKQHGKKMPQEWRLQNPLLFSEEGELLDGQHRLLAVHESGATVPFMIQLIPADETTEANLATDAGVPRNLVDFLHFQGVMNAMRTAPVLVYERNARISRSPFQEAKGEKADYLRLYRSLPDGLLRKAFDAVPRGFHSQFGVKRAVVDWLSLQLVQISETDAQAFFAMIQNPASLKETDAPYVASRRLLETAAKGGRSGVKPTPIDTGTMLVKAWNAYYQDRPVRSGELIYRIREEFPGILGAHE
jgi:hypothetical protein